MSSRSSPRNSRRSSPRKPSPSPPSEAAEIISDLIPAPAAPSLKIRLKAPIVSSSSTGELAPAPANEKLTMKIKLNFSKSSSNESVGGEGDYLGQKKRGRPRKDPKAIHEAALAASTPNELELRDRKTRRQATEEKIRKSVSSEVVTPSPFVSGGKRLKFDKLLTNDYVDILGGKRDLSSMPTSMSSSTSSMPSVTSVTSTASTGASFTVNPNENEFVQKSKNTLNVALQQDQGTLQTPSFTPFASLTDAVERLLPYHLALNAGQYEEDGQITAFDPIQLESSYSGLLTRFKSIIHAQHSKPVSTELLLLEQRLCLEEEKFLLQKMKNDYQSRYMAAVSQVSSRSTTPKQ